MNTNNFRIEGTNLFPFETFRYSPELARKSSYTNSICKSCSKNEKAVKY
ncbi:hypothetical protein LEP1GSC125_0857 [Leptospira mayottensis 200901122]|uniref:Uncharacterized protein n=1 Tax=Leptospira mayottensis 200901122 TaxID=1193010 RepID=A0AA87SZ15_9LEPT|nr:hypothetical protein LEP1GSC125_0857 [Leptospira mayottensis 200901122]